jgi:hypothetical protein
MKISNEVRRIATPLVLEASAWLTSSMGGVLVGNAIGRIASGYEAVSSLILGFFVIILCVLVTSYRIILMTRRHKDIKIKIRKRRTKRQMEMDTKVTEEPKPQA